MTARLWPLCAAVALGLAGCGPGANDWEVVVENRSRQPVSASVAYNTFGRVAKADDLAAGTSTRLAWDGGGSHLWNIRVKSAAGEQNLRPVDELAARTRYRVVIDAQGKATVEEEPR